MDNTQQFQYEREIPNILTAMTGVHTAINASGLAPRLQHLIMLRASQLNACAYCIQRHLREARADGESDERLDPRTGLATG